MEKTRWICHTLLLWEDSRQFPLWRWEFSHPQDMQMTFFICSFYVICIIFSCKSESCQKLTIWGFNIQFHDLFQSIRSLWGPRNFGCQRVEDTEKWVREGTMDGDEQGGKDTWLHLNSLLVFIFFPWIQRPLVLFLSSQQHLQIREKISLLGVCWYSG